MSPEKKDSPDKPSRRFRRFPLVSYVEITLKGKDKALIGLVDNVNRGGIGIYSKEPLPVDQEVQLRLTFLSPEGERVKEDCEGRIVQMIPHEDRYILGIAFKESLSKDRNPQLQAYIETRDQGN